ncbi:hypothetical protein J3F84DRAFT_407087 [Trichoderma pleuroticola]
MELEAREAAAFGLRPNPVADWEPYEDEIEAWKSIGETEPLVGPNSQWVDSKKYPQWTGEGERCDSVKMAQLEELQFRLQVKFDRLIGNTTHAQFTRHSAEPPYQHYLHDEGKAILCMNNFARQDQLFGKPGRLFWSDLMAVYFSQTMTACGRDTNGLEAIWRINIVNQDTQNVIMTYCKDKAVEFGTGDEGFYALLATDHGKGPARMLATYPRMFGR